MKITVLVPNLSGNCLGRGYLLARVLERDYAVEIGGVMKGPRIWPAFDDGHFDYFRIDEREPQEKALVNISGDVIYASKLLPTSFGLALLKKQLDGTPVVLDIDDWELAFMLPHRLSFSFFVEKVGSFFRRRSWCRINYFQELLFEKRVKEADAITTASTYLQNRFGGVLVPHGRDTDTFDPCKFDRDLWRCKYNLSNNKVVTFIGTPRKHKGLEYLIDAVKLSKTKNIKLLVAGMNPDAMWEDRIFQDRLRKRADNKVLFIAMFPFGDLPNYLAMSDLVVLPQGLNERLPIRDKLFVRAQVPAKVFDAMAMEKPLIATAVSDLPRILKGCGYVVPIADEKKLTEKIDEVFADYDEALNLAKKAREKCIEEYSWDAMQRTLRDVFSRFEARRQAKVLVDNIDRNRSNSRFRTADNKKGEG